VAVLVTAAAASAQGAKWKAPYEKGVAAIKVQKWDDAIAALQQAIAIDSIPSANKHEEGVFTSEYFPQYYLFVAYLKKGDTTKARQSYAAKGQLTSKLSAEAAGLYAELQKAEQAMAVLAQNKTQFDALVRSAETALAAKKYDDAIGAYEAANRLLPDEFRNQKLDSKLNDARGSKAAEQRAADQRAADQRAAELRAEQARLEQRRQEQLRQEAAAKALENARALTSEGRTLLGEGRLTDARGKFQAAQQQVAGFKDAADGLAEIQGREREYTAARARADQLNRLKDYVRAYDEYGRARALNPEAFNRDKLAAVVAAIDQILGVRLLVDAANTAFAQKRWAEAASTAASVLQKEPQNRQMETLRARAESRIALDTANSLTAAKRFKEADAKLAEAISKDATNRDAVDARSRNRQLMAAAEKAAAEKAAAERLAAEKLAAQRAAAERAAAEKAGAATSAANSPDELARQGLLALFNGRPHAAIDPLLQAITGSRTADKTRRATLYAYLGVAYANLSLQSAGADADRLKSQAMDQFRQARELQPALKLSDRLVSPRVRELYEPRGRSGSYN
jgi:hypothetical protein